MVSRKEQATRSQVVSFHPRSRRAVSSQCIAWQCKACRVIRKSWAPAGGLQMPPFAFAKLEEDLSHPQHQSLAPTPKMTITNQHRISQLSHSFVVVLIDNLHNPTHATGVRLKMLATCCHCLWYFRSCSSRKPLVMMPAGKAKSPMPGKERTTSLREAFSQQQGSLQSTQALEALEAKGELRKMKNRRTRRKARTGLAKIQSRPWLLETR